jgi:membrane-associated phospholipid phosphatase
VRKATRPGTAALLAVFLGGAFVPGLSAQGNPPAGDREENVARGEWRFGRAFLRQSAADFKSVLTSPGRWGAGDWAGFAALAGAGTILFVFDGKAYDWVQRQRTEGSVDASSVISKFGNGGYLAGLMAALYASGEIFDDRGLRKTSLLCLESFLSTTALVWTGKIVLGRARPYADEGVGSFRPFSFENGHHSLPSGDAAGAFAVASVIAAESKSFLVDALAYGAAGLAALWRVHDRKHWPSDVFIGSALGFFVGRAVASLHDEGRATADVGLTWNAGSNGRSVTLRFSF